MTKEKSMIEISPYEQGVIAARSEKSPSDNPYREGTDFFYDWEQGFEDYLDWHWG